MKRNWVVALAVACLTSSQPSFSQSNLPKEVQSDLLLKKIEAALAAGNGQAALQGVTEYRRLGTTVPPALLFLEGKLAAIQKDFKRSKEALTEYFAQPDVKANKNYSEALEIYADVENNLAAEAKAKNDAKLAADAAMTPEQRAERDRKEEIQQRADRCAFYRDHAAQMDGHRKDKVFPAPVRKSFDNFYKSALNDVKEDCD